MIYTANSRANELCRVNFVDKYYPMNKGINGYIYSLNRREQHIKGSSDMLIIHYIERCN